MRGEETGSSGFALGHSFLNANAVLVEAAGIEPAVVSFNFRHLGYSVAARGERGDCVALVNERFDLK
jgi:hypothetical protein